MKRIFAVVIWLFGIYLTDVYAEVTESNPIQKYVKKGHESVLQCIYEDSTLIWSVKNKDSRKTIASGDAVTNSTRYKVSTNPTTNLYYRLHVLNAQPDDELIYRCETGNLRYYIQLTLYLPPTGLYFYGSANNITLEGTEGKDLLIRCIAVGGNPQPYVSILYGTRPNKTQQVSYTIPTISRDKHQGLIKCQATSNALDNPMTATVQIYLNLSPLKPILNTNEINTEETVPLTVSCTSYGSRPAATFTWTIGGNNVTSNSSTSPPFKESNDTYTVTSTLIFSVNKTHNKQKIICQASNTEGSVRAGNTLDVKYAPDITVNSPTYTQNDAIRTVTCNPSGNPDNYTYNKWQHKSKYGDLIREFDGNKTLKLPDAPVILRYQDSGEYVCTASNGIKNKDNKFEQSGSKYVTINAQPAFTSDTIGRVKQFGELNKAVDMYVNVYSVPKFTSNIWTRDGTQITTQNTASFPTVVKDEIYGTEVQMDGYNVTLTIRDLKVADFANYTVTLKNEFGTVKYTIILESASRPEIPGNFSNIASSSTSITVQWDPNSGGGYKQTFYLEYRVQGSIDWITEKTGEEDINESKSRRRYELRNLLAGKTYELRMFAENTAEKRSNVTEVLVAFTESSGHQTRPIKRDFKRNTKVKKAEVTLTTENIEG